jgi:hypothetical protein
MPFTFLLWKQRRPVVEVHTRAADAVGVISAVGTGLRKVLRPVHEMAVAPASECFRSQSCSTMV